MSEVIWGLGLLAALCCGLWLVRGSRPRAESAVNRRKVNAQAYQDQLDALHARQEQGELDEQQFAQAKAVLNDALKQELTAEAETLNLRPWRPLQQGLLLSFAVLAAGLVFFWSDGQQHVRQPAQAAAGPATHSIEEMVAGLEQRLQAEPDDLRGWAMLGRSYSVLERPEDAARAYAQANVLSQFENVELLVAEAEALGMAQNQRLAGKPEQLLEAALELDPHHIRGLWYAIIAAAQRGDSPAQQAFVQRLAAEPELPPELAALLKSEFGVDAAAVEVVEKTAATGPVAIDVEVSLDPGLSAVIPAQATLFVYAKALSGPPMPLAISRQPVPQSWPVRIRLDDSSSMLPSMKLSSFSAWTVIARISPSGQAQPQSGDWQSQVELNAPPQEALRLEISKQLP